MQQLKRNIAMTFRVTEEEQALIRRRMAQTNITNLRAYLLKMAVDGRVIDLDLTSVNECSKLLRNASSNINQIARRINENGNVYAADMEDIKNRLDGVWQQQNVILTRIAKLLEVA